MEAEPGSGRLDLSLKEGEEYVEVKTTASEPDEVWTVEKIADTNGKVADANVDATPDNTALELRLQDDSRTNTEIRNTVERGINTQIAGGGTVNVKEIRLVVNGEELAPIQP